MPDDPTPPDDAALAELLPLLVRLRHRVSLNLLAEGWRFRLDVREDETSAPVPEKPRARPSRHPRHSPRCADYVVEVLRAAGRRMTVQDLVAAFERESVPLGQSTIEHTLPGLRKDGILDNDRDEHGVGFGLAEWSVPPPAETG